MSPCVGFCGRFEAEDEEISIREQKNEMWANVGQSSKMTEGRKLVSFGELEKRKKSRIFAILTGSKIKQEKGQGLQPHPYPTHIGRQRRPLKGFTNIYEDE